MDWEDVMRRPDYTHDEKVALRKSECERRGWKFYPDEVPRPKRTCKPA